MASAEKLEKGGGKKLVKDLPLAERMLAYLLKTAS
jgi:hypothetical protein